jgi:hypothetical protein
MPLDRRTRELMQTKSTWKVPLPEPMVWHDPCTCGFGPTPKRKPQFAAGALVGNLHKSSCQVLFKSELKYAGRKV